MEGMLVMKYSADEVMQYINEEDVKFIRLAFCDVYGRPKNISILPTELPRAFEHGIGIDATAIDGFGDETYSDMFLHPDPSTLSILPWRPEHGRVVRMYCSITRQDGTPVESDTRSLLIKAIDEAKKEGVTFSFGSELEFYLFNLDDNGKPTNEPYDSAGYLDMAPEDRGENVRREICLMLEQMDIIPESSHHEEGPGQNEIVFRYSDPLSAADNAVAFKTVVKTVAGRNGLYADFSPKPIDDKPGNGYHINISVKNDDNNELLTSILAGIMHHIKEMTAFLNPTVSSYSRFGTNKAPQYISWSKENRSQLIRIPAAVDGSMRAELRSPDPMTNPYLAFALLIFAGIEGIKNNYVLPQKTNMDMYEADEDAVKSYEKLPQSLAEAKKHASESDFIAKRVPKCITNIYCK